MRKYFIRDFLTAKNEFIQNRRKDWEKVFEITENDSEFCLSLHWNFKRFMHIRLKIISNSFWKMFNQPLTMFYACNHNKMIVESKRIKNFHCKWHENNNQNCQLMFFFLQKSMNHILCALMLIAGSCYCEENCFSKCLTATIRITTFRPIDHPSSH